MTDPSQPTPTLLRRLLRGLGTLLAAIWIVLEEWVWNSLTAAMAWVGRLPPVRWLEARIRALPPWAAMVVFLVPVLLLLPAKLLALWLLGTGHIRSAVAVFVIAKVIGTALAARLFALTKPRLLTIGWFRRLHDRFERWRARLHAWLREVRIWQRAKAALRRVRTALRQWYRTVFSR